jgi:hypothetical protein
MLLKKNPSPSQLPQGPVISFEHVKRHLVLLHAFHEQRKNVEELDRSLLEPDIAALDRTQRWALFVTRAVERYVSCLAGMLPTKARLLLTTILNLT